MVMMARPLGAAALAVLPVVLLAASGCAARDLYVGGRDGWTTNPGEPHNRWAERNRFQVNDTLVFRYNKDADGVLLVTQSHYDACNTSEPVLRLDGGDSRFVFPASGPYFFISADAGRCKAGERLIVVVLAVRSPPLPPSPPPPTPKPASSSSPPKPAPSSAPPSPPPVPSPGPRAVPPLPPPPPSPSAGNASSPSPAPLIAPMPGTNGTHPPPSKSAAVTLRAGVLACLIVGGAAIL